MKQFATITVIGKDKTGVVARVTSYLFEQKANIEALEEQVTRGQFSMTIQASWKPRQLNAGTVRAGFDRLAKSLGMEIKLRFTEPHRRSGWPSGSHANRIVWKDCWRPQEQASSMPSGRSFCPTAAIWSRWREVTACLFSSFPGKTAPTRRSARSKCWTTT